MTNLNSQVSSINNKQDFLIFMQMLIKDLKEHKDSWENKTLYDYLSAIYNWTEDMDGYYENLKIEPPKDIDWKTFASILTASRIYE